MKKYFFFIFLFAYVMVHAQSVPNYIYGKDVIISMRDTSSAELTIKNSTRTVTGFLKNIGAGKTTFKVLDIADVTGLQTALNGKLSATITTPSTGNLIRYNGSTWVNWIPTFLDISDTAAMLSSRWLGSRTLDSLTAIQARIQSKQPLGSYLEAGNNLADVTNIVTARYNIGLGNVPNVDATNASNISSGTLDDARLTSNVTLQGNSFNGVNQLVKTGGDGKLPAGVLPSLAITETFTVASQAAMLALAAQTGDVAVRTDEQKTYILAAEPATTLANWVWMQFPDAENDPIYTASSWYSTTNNSSNWNTAYSWGNWAAGSHYIGTTLIANNRASASQSLTGVSIDGTAGSETLATVTGRGNATTNDITGGRIFSTQTNALIQAYDASGTSAALRAYSGANYWDFAVKATSTLNFDFLGTTKVSIDNTGGITAGAISGTSGAFSGNVLAGGYVDVGYDGTYGPAYVGIGFHGTTTGGTNGQNRIFASRNGTDGLYLASATGTPIVFRPSGGTYDMVTVASSTVSVNTTNPSSWTFGVGGGTGNGMRVYYGTSSGNSIFDTYGDATYGGIARIYKIDGVTTGIILRGDGLITSAALAGSGNVIVGSDNSGNIFKITIGSGLSYSGGTLSATGGASGTVTGSGTSGIIALWNSASDIGNSIMSQSGSAINVAGKIRATNNQIEVTDNGTIINEISFVAATAGLVGTTTNHDLRIQRNSITKITVSSSSVTFVDGITASSFSGAGTGLTGTASSLTAGDASRLGGYVNNISVAIQSATIQAILGHDTNNNIYRYNASAVQTFLGLGSAAYTASSAYYAAGSTVYNSDRWGGYTVDYSTAYDGGFDFIYARTSATGEARLVTPVAVKAWLGLGSYAYRSSGLAELSGASFTGNISTTGTITASGGGFNSDLTLKKIIAINPQTDIADKVTLIKHSWVNKQAYGDGEYYGYGAQWIQSILPEAVYTNESTGKLAVNYTMVHSVMLNEHTREINELKSEIITLKKMLNEIRN